MNLAANGIRPGRQSAPTGAASTGTDSGGDDDRARFRAAIDAVQGILWTNDAEGRMVGEQPGWAALTGQAYAEYQGYGWSKAVHPEDAQATIDAWMAAVEERRTFAFEHRVRRRDGEWRVFSIRAVPTFDTSGELREWVGVHTDITERRAAECALRELMATLEQRVETAIAERDRTWNNARDLILVLDTEGVFRAANPAWTAILGWEPREIIGRSYRDFIHGEDRASAFAVLAAASGSDLKGHELRVLHKDGSYRWVSWVAAPEGDMIYANGRDVTAEKKAAEAFERSESRFRAIFQTSYQYKGIAALDGVLLDANPTSLRGIKASLAEVVGKPLWETPWFTGTPGIADMVRNAVAEVAKGETVRKEALINLPTGPKWFDFTMRPIRDARGYVVAIVPEAADITARREAEDALRQSQKLEAIGQLTGGIAHDFNNLLTPIVGSLDLLQRNCRDDGQTSRLISAALRSAERARILVQRLLSFARRQHLETRPVNLKRLVDGMLDLIGRALGPQIEVRIEIADDLPDASVDPNQLEVALLNLAVNARDAMPDGGVISIVAEAADVGDGEGALRQGPYVRLSLSDNGIGMSPETLARAIEPFFSTKGVGKGTGLGLSMVHGLAAQSGGQLQLESAPGRGTTATLWLPAVEGAPDEARAAPADEVVRCDPLSILLVDDDDLVRAGAVAMLESIGHTVVEASSGQRALEHIASGKSPDVLVTDQRMPNMTGRELVRRAKILRPGLPAVLITGFSDPAGADDDLPRLAKPFRAADLARTIAAAVGSKS